VVSAADVDVDWLEVNIVSEVVVSASVVELASLEEEVKPASDVVDVDVNPLEVAAAVELAAVVDEEDVSVTGDVVDVAVTGQRGSASQT
jgi:ribosomal protein L3